MGIRSIAADLLPTALQQMSSRVSTPKPTDRPEAASFAALTDKLGQVYAGVPAETAEAEINAAVRHVRRRRSR